VNSPDDLARALLEAAWITARIAAGLGLAAWVVGAAVGLGAFARRGGPLPPGERAAARAGALAQVAALIVGGAVIGLTRGEAVRVLPALAQALVAALAALVGPLGGMLGAWSARTLARGEGLIVRGPFALVRHPLYLSLGLVIASSGLALGSLSGTAAASALVLAASAWRARREDEALARAHGDAFAAYAARVHALRPRL
jgi:protein-S-isoprenylcysteine O-methyltransferase Ste14